MILNYIILKPVCKIHTCHNCQLRMLRASNSNIIKSWVHHVNSMISLRNPIINHHLNNHILPCDLSVTNIFSKHPKRRPEFLQSLKQTFLKYFIRRNRTVNPDVLSLLRGGLIQPVANRQRLHWQTAI